ncbi:hypothetical protein [Alienimonas chondri]|uniref:Uncharacterized protein n=1 Tax=Alienimonas chondri TaxID=2681879 RepID=A0ABX1V8X9_9PLAN|nr:hypothetical protein [Alienimonas chondri]NNJ24583.1 hypothetical protein [Alienimonas chondri]
MKAFAVAVVVLLVLALLGWFTLSADNDQAGININRDVISEDVGNAAGAVKDGAEKVKSEAERVDVDVDVDRE